MRSSFLSGYIEKTSKHQTGVVRLEQASQQASNDYDDDDDEDVAACLQESVAYLCGHCVDVAAAAAAAAPWSLGFRHLAKPSILLLYSRIQNSVRF